MLLALRSAAAIDSTETVNALGAVIPFPVEPTNTGASTAVASGNVKVPVAAAKTVIITVSPPIEEAASVDVRAPKLDASDAVMFRASSANVNAPK